MFPFGLSKPRDNDWAMLVSDKCVSVKVSEPELKKRNPELSVLLEMSNLLTASIELQTILSSALVKVIDFFRLDAGRIYLLDESGKFLNLVVHQGMEPKGLECVPISEGFSGKSVRTRSFLAQSVSELRDKKRASLLLSKGFEVIICVPLIIADRVEGVMNVASKKRIQLDPAMIDLLTTMGNQIAVAANDAKMYEDLQKKIQTLQEKEKTITFFAYSISHDLKSPATSIHALTERLTKKYASLLDDKGKEHCEQIKRAARELVSLVEKINAYVMSKEAPVHFELVRIQEVLDAVRSEFSPFLRQRRVKWSTPRELPDIVADRLCLVRIFRNLVDNALKYGGEELSRISVEYRETTNLHIFSVQDDGVGIKEKDRECMFDVFSRNGTSRGIAGSGLGLAIVKEAAIRHGGTAWVESGTQQGATLSISIRKEFTPME